MITNIRHWWFFNFRLPHILKRSGDNLRNEYQQYLNEAVGLGIHALSYPDWCGVTSIPTDIDKSELAHNTVLGLYPVCACGDWMHQHENFSGKCSECRPHFESENCQEFKLAWYEAPQRGNEIPVAIAFNQAIYECD